MKPTNREKKLRQKLLDLCIEVDVNIDAVRHYSGGNNKQYSKEFIENTIHQTKKSLLQIEKDLSELNER